MEDDRTISVADVNLQDLSKSELLGLISKLESEYGYRLIRTDIDKKTDVIRSLFDRDELGRPIQFGVNQKTINAIAVIADIITGNYRISRGQEVAEKILPQDPERRRIYITLVRNISSVITEALKKQGGYVYGPNKEVNK